MVSVLSNECREIYADWRMIVPIRVGDQLIALTSWRLIARRLEL
jgi:hypothetical protein